MSELEEMRCFAQLAEAGSATQAAARMGVAVSAVSRRLKDLETRLGVQLVNRTTRRMSLTDEGRGFYNRVTRILAEIAEAEAEASRRGDGLRGRIRIAAPVSFGVAHLSGAVAAFMHAHPELSVSLDLSDRRVDLVEDGFDLAIRAGALDDSSLRARKIAEFRHVVCAAPSFFAQRGAPRRPRDLSGWPGLCYGNLPNPPLWSYRGPDGEKGSVRVATRLEATNGDVLREAAIAGLGVLCEPSFIVHAAVAQGLLQPALTEYRWYEMGIYAIYPPTRYLPERVRRFIDFLAGRFGPTPYWDDAIF